VCVVVELESDLTPIVILIFLHYFFTSPRSLKGRTGQDRTGQDRVEYSVVDTRQDRARNDRGYGYEISRTTYKTRVSTSVN
jgi:hypothetical protein